MRERKQTVYSGGLVETSPVPSTTRTRTFRVLDAFCGEGGAASGYHQGFREAFRNVIIVGVDTSAARLERYPFTGVRGDAIEYVAQYGDGFDLIHGSPPCTGYSRGTAAVPDRLERYDRLIGAFREVAAETGVPYVIENVADARPELRTPIMLCGRMFGLTAVDLDDTPLTLDRHRLFEVSVPIMAPEHTPHGWLSNRRAGVQVAGSYGGGRRNKYEARHVRHGGYVPGSADVQRELVGVPWMSEVGCRLAIPPAYTRWLAHQIVDQL